MWFVSQTDSARVKIAEHLNINLGNELAGIIPALKEDRVIKAEFALTVA